MRRVRRKSPIDYLLPFLMILGLGIIIVLVLQLWSSWGKAGQGDIYFYVVEGQAKILPYGKAEWDQAYSGTKFLIGDSLKTSRSGKAVIEFFNGTIVRIGDDTSITLSDVEKKPDKETIVLTLDDGELWLNGKKSQGVKEAFYEVRTSNTTVKAMGTAFEVESNGLDEAVRVFSGEVTVDILVSSNGTKRVADTKSVGVGQELILDEASLKAFADNNSPSVLQALSDEFKDTEWYKWNVKEDKDPTRFGRVPEELNVEEEEMEEETEEEEVAEIGAPEITSPESASVSLSEGESLKVTGTIPEIAAEIKVKVNGEEQDVPGFEAGDAVFEYEISEKEENVEAGENIYVFYAVDADGKKGGTISLTVNYEKEVIEIEGELTAPKPVTFNGSTSSTVTDSEVVIKGTVSGAAKVVVNDYTLSAFKPGDTEWAYYAKESLGNLVPGENEYEVYALDENDNKSEITEFTIIYEKPEAPATEEIPEYGF
jgi:hypothetical protein